MPNKIGNDVKCSHCGTIWKVRSKSMWISCTNCLQKTRNININKDEESYIDMEKKTKIKYVAYKKILKTQNICGVDKDEVNRNIATLSKIHDIPIGEINIEFV